MTWTKEQRERAQLFQDSAFKHVVAQYGAIEAFLRNATPKVLEDFTGNEDKLGWTLAGAIVREPFLDGTPLNAEVLGKKHGEQIAQLMEDDNLRAECIKWEPQIEK